LTVPAVIKGERDHRLSAEGHAGDCEGKNHQPRHRKEKKAPQVIKDTPGTESAQEDAGAPKRLPKRL
jgi:hypothetical protein